MNNELINQTAFDISKATAIAMIELKNTGQALPPKLHDVVAKVAYDVMFRHVYMT
jgi:hypothetical protein